jgi:hypothetical protein
MGKIILHYEDNDTLEMLLRNIGNYLASENANEYGTNSMTVFVSLDNSQTAYFQRNKSGSYTVRAWKEPRKLSGGV